MLGWVRTREENGQVPVTLRSWLHGLPNSSLVCGDLVMGFPSLCHALSLLLCPLTTACLLLRWPHPFTLVQIICIRLAWRPFPLSKVSMSVFCPDVASRQGITEKDLPSIPMTYTKVQPTSNRQHLFKEMMHLSVAQWYSMC